MIPKSSADIWAVGCVFSELLIATQAGHKGRKKYRDRRRTEIDGYDALKSAGFTAVFHSIERRLQTIDKIHGEVLHAQASSSIGHVMSNFILEDMLQAKPEKRKRAHALATEIHKAVSIRKDGLVPGTEKAKVMEELPTTGASSCGPNQAREDQSNIDHTSTAQPSSVLKSNHDFPFLLSNKSPTTAANLSIYLDQRSILSKTLIRPLRMSPMP